MRLMHKPARIDEGRHLVRREDVLQAVVPVVAGAAPIRGFDTPGNNELAGFVGPWGIEFDPYSVMSKA